MAKNKKQKDSQDDLEEVFGADDMEVKCKHCGEYFILEEGYDEKHCSEVCFDNENESKERLFTLENVIDGYDAGFWKGVKNPIDDMNKTFFSQTKEQYFKEKFDIDIHDKKNNK